MSQTLSVFDLMGRLASSIGQRGSGRGGHGRGGGHRGGFSRGGVVVSRGGLGGLGFGYPYGYGLGYGYGYPAYGLGYAYPGYGYAYAYPGYVAYRGYPGYGTPSCTDAYAKWQSAERAGAPAETVEALKNRFVACLYQTY